jgi:hypothetical protein
MTVDDRYLIDFKDLEAIRFECGACGTALTIPLDKWAGIQESCPSCRVIWVHPHTPQFQTLLQLSAGLRGTRAIAKEAGYLVRFEMVKPK